MSRTVPCSWFTLHINFFPIGLISINTSPSIVPFYQCYTYSVFSIVHYYVWPSVYPWRKREKMLRYHIYNYMPLYQYFCKISVTSTFVFCSHQIFLNFTFHHLYMRISYLCIIISIKSHFSFVMEGIFSLSNYSYLSIIKYSVWYESMWTISMIVSLIIMYVPQCLFTHSNFVFNRFNVCVLEVSP